MLNAISQFLPTSGTKADSLRCEDAFGAFSVDEYRPMKVAIIGAGASGIIAAIR